MDVKSHGEETKPFAVADVEAGEPPRHELSERATEDVFDFSSVLEGDSALRLSEGMPDSFVETSIESLATSSKGASATARSAESATEPVLPKFDEASDRTVLNLAHKSAMIVDAFPDRIPNARELEDMTRAFGYDLVSMALVKILANVSPNRYFLERVDRVYRDIQVSASLDRQLAPGKKVSEKRASTTDGMMSMDTTPVAERAELCVIESVDPLTPGARWGDHVERWRSWGRRAGLTTDVIQTDKNNSLLANAEKIRRELALQPHDRRVIATVGQGSAEFRLLMEQLLKTAPDELHGIQMWVNVAGLVRGGSGVSLKRRPWWDRKMLEVSTRLRGWPRSMSHQLSHLNPRLRTEPELRGLPFICVSMVGLPSVRDVPSGLKSSFLELAKQGPNDGLATFHESIVRPGYIVPVPGMSHRAEADRLGPWFQAVLSSFAFDRGHAGDFDRPDHVFDLGGSERGQA